jgi:tRNA A58 N-methylase Trm61
MGGGTGTGVPGITSGNPTAGGSGTKFFRNETLSDRLGDLEIPDDQVENYVDALEGGRSIVAYFAKPETIDKVSEIFRASGLAKVKTF